MHLRAWWLTELQKKVIYSELSRLKRPHPPSPPTPRSPGNQSRCKSSITRITPFGCTHLMKNEVLIRDRYKNAKCPCPELLESGYIPCEHILWPGRGHSWVGQTTVTSTLTAPGRVTSSSTSRCKGEATHVENLLEIRADVKTTALLPGRLGSLLIRWAKSRVISFLMLSTA